MNARGLAPRGAWRVLRGPGGTVAVDDDGDRVLLQDRPARALEVLRRRAGGTTTTELLTDLATPPEEVGALARDLADLVRAGLLVRTDVTAPPRVAVLATGSADTTELGAALTAAGTSPAEPSTADLVVLCCDDHGASDLADVLTETARTRAVLLVRWGAGRCWIGPLVEAGTGHRDHGSCPECLLEALRRNVGSRVLAGSFDTAPGSRRAQSGLVATVLQGLLGDAGTARTSRDTWHARIREVDLRTTDVVSHPVAPCPRSSSNPPPVPGELLERLDTHTSALTGILDPPRVRRSRDGWFLATTTHPVRSRSLEPGTPWRRATAFGAGRTRTEALTACAGEAVERFSTSWRPVPDARTTTARDLRAEGFRVWTPAQLLHLENSAQDPATRPDDVPTEYRRLRAVVGGAPLPVWVPAAATTFGHPDRTTARASRPDSSGCAAGRDTTDAVRRGLAELLERDAVALWWWPRRPRPGLPLTLLGSGAGGDVRERLATHGRTGWLLDLTTDVGVPVVAAVSVRTDGTGTTLGFGAARTRTDAARRATDELLQVLACLEFGEEFGLTGAGTPQWQAQDGRTLPFLRPHGELDVPHDGPGSTAHPTAEPTDEDVLHDWSTRLALAGVDVGWLDLTDPTVGIPVVRVVSAQLRPWHRRLGPGRLRLDGPENPWDLPV